jgi:putative transcriptional regulator
LVLKGQLLVALPVLRDMNFDRTVVLVIEHDPANGAVGLVLNRPSPLSVGEPLEPWAPLAAEPAVVFVGGPVSPSSAIGLAVAAAADEGGAGWHIVDLAAGPDAAEQTVARVRVFAGYAGWGQAQLEDEIAAGAWLVIDAAPGDLMTGAPEELWEEVLRRQGGRTAAVASFPDDPRLN